MVALRGRGQLALVAVLGGEPQIFPNAVGADLRHLRPLEERYKAVRRRAEFASVVISAKATSVGAGIGQHSGEPAVGHRVEPVPYIYCPATGRRNDALSKPTSDRTFAPEILRPSPGLPLVGRPGGSNMDGSAGDLHMHAGVPERAPPSGLNRLLIYAEAPTDRDRAGLHGLLQLLQAESIYSRTLAEPKDDFFPRNKVWF